jgi:DNA-binding CsgD family transcriptional regulator
MPKITLGAKNIKASNRKKKFSMHARREKIMRMMARDPSMTQRALAKQLNVDVSTISNDIRELNRSLNIENLDAWAVQRARVLREIQANKLECMDRIQRCTQPTQGARWMEEWTKLTEREIKILGLASPEKLLIKQETTIKPEAQDAAVDGILKSFDMNVVNTVVDKDGIIRVPKKEITKKK